MAVISQTGQLPNRVAHTRGRSRHTRTRWWALVLMLLVTAVAVSPIVAVLGLSVHPAVSSSSTQLFTLENFVTLFSQRPALTWLANSVSVALATVLVSVVIAAPAGYALSRGRGRLVSGYALLLFIIQSLPAITSVIPLFVIFSRLHLVDTLAGITVVYISGSLAVSTWMFSAYFDTIPVSLEEAAWIDGCSLVGGFLRVVLPNALPAVLSAAIFTFLVAWNDYLVAIVFLRSTPTFTLQVGIQSFFQQTTTDWGAVMAAAVVMMLPPSLLFAVLHRFFNIGGIGGSLAGT